MEGPVPGVRPCDRRFPPHTGGVGLEHILRDCDMACRQTSAALDASTDHGCIIACCLCAPRGSRAARPLNGQGATIAFEGADALAACVEAAGGAGYRGPPPRPSGMSY